MIDNLRLARRLPKGHRRKLNMSVDQNVKYRLQILAKYHNASMTETCQGIINAYWDCYESEIKASLNTTAED